MKIEITIKNGSGWNNYEALRSLKCMPRGTKGLLKSNGIAKLIIGPADSEKPFGIAAKYFDKDGDLIFTQHFDQNDSSAWIRSRVTALLEEGIDNRLAAIRAKRAAEALAKAKAAGFESVEAHKAHIAAQIAAEQSKRAQERAERDAFLRGENGGREAANAAMQEMRQLRAACPEADGMTRGGKLGKLINPDKPHGGWSQIFEQHVFDSDLGMKAWLAQNGHRPSIDDRHYFFIAAA